MQNTDAIAHLPIVTGILLSIAVHTLLLQGKELNFLMPEPEIKEGKTTIQLTLLPTMASPQRLYEPAPEQPAEEVPTRPAQLPVSPSTEIIPEPETKEKTATEARPDTIPPISTIEEPFSTGSIDQDATLETEKGVTSDANATTPFHPVYPRVSRRRSEEGTVVLSVQVLADGTLGLVEIKSSSGYRRLDEAAVKGARKTTFKPALSRGRVIDATIELSYTFRLTDD